MASTYTINNLAPPTGNVTIANGGSSWAYGTGSTVTLNSGGAGTSGSYLVTGAGANGTSSTYTTAWANPSTNFNDGNDPVMTIPYGTKTVEIDKAATLDVKGVVKINGIDLEERLSTIETLLQIPTRDVTMETKHPKLAELYKAYMHELEKYKTWDRIKGDEDGTT